MVRCIKFLRIMKKYARFFDCFIPVIAAIVATIALIKSPVGKGIIGEALLNFVINIALNKKQYQLLKNITLQTDDGTTQIDHIIVSQYGIFVIETKNYKGWIFGDEYSKTWTQSIYGKKHLAWMTKRYIFLLAIKWPYL